MSSTILRGRGRARSAVVAVLSATSLVALAACGGAPKDAPEADATSSSSASADGTITIKDVADRTVTLDKKPERIVLGEGRGLFVTGALDQEHPFDKVVAMGTDLKSNVPDFYNKLAEKDPKLKDIPEIGNLSKGDVTVENLLSFDPDVVVISIDQYNAAEKRGDITQLDNAGIKYVVTDFRQHPLTNTTASVEVYGKLLGKEDKAEEFNNEWTRVVDMVKDRAAKATDKPKTFVWRAAGLKSCCASWNNSNISELVNSAGGHNLGDEVIKGESGDLTPEEVIHMEPDLIIATGGDWVAKKDKDGNPVHFAASGYDISADTAIASLKELSALQPGFELLEAPKNDKLYVLWHQFYNSPFNYLALLQIAKWIHPDDYMDVDMVKEWKNAHDKFSPLDGSGSFFVSSTSAGPLGDK